jgi:hypothetical protein
VPISLLWASLHVLVFLGLLGFARSGLAGTSRSARLGPQLILAGTALLLTAVGFLAAGIATVRSRLWRGWRRFTPLSAGIAACALLSMNSTKALPAGVALYGLCLLVLGIALYTQPAPEPAETPRLAVRQQPV